MDRTTMDRTTTAIIVLFVAACSGGSSDAESDAGIPTGDDPGQGSSTLLVRGIVEATELVNSAVDPEDFSSSFSITVTLNGEEVRDATVTVSSVGGSVDLEFDSSGNPGKYRGTQVGYFSDYRFDIDAGEDFVGGVIVEAPHVHRIEAPLPGARVPANEDLVVQWTRDGVADIVMIESRETDSTNIVDSGTYTINASDLRQDSERDEDERIRLFRSTKVIPDGAVAGSELEVRLRNSVEFIVEASD